MRLLALLLVTVSFVVLLCWVFWPSNRARFEAHGRLALQDPESDKEDRDE